MINIIEKTTAPTTNKNNKTVVHGNLELNGNKIHDVDFSAENITISSCNFVIATKSLNIFSPTVTITNCRFEGVEEEAFLGPILADIKEMYPDVYAMMMLKHEGFDKFVQKYM